MIYDIKDFKAEITEEFNGLVQKEFNYNGSVVNMYFYLIQYNELFNNDVRREMRGITFVDNDKYFLSLHKFFNINQHPETQLSLLKDKEIIEITDKLDGSLINPILINGKLIMKSKASITSQQSKNSTDFVYDRKHYYNFIIEMMEKELHPIFEYVAPDNKIVLDYDKEDLILLQIRDNNGNYLNLNDFDIPKDITIRKEYNLKEFNSLDKIYEYIRESVDLEGVVIRFSDGMMVKLKSEWYLDKHHYTNLTEKDYMVHILDDTIDDVLSLGELVDTQYIKKCIKAVNTHIAFIMAYVIEYDYDYDTIQEFVKESLGDIHFTYLIDFYKNKDSEKVSKNVREQMKKNYNKLDKCKLFFKENIQ